MGGLGDALVWRSWRAPFSASSGRSHDKPAGLRTYALVSQGAALFMVARHVALERRAMAATPWIPPASPRTVVQGIGFLAGGVIFTVGARVKGLTTAAGIWVAAAARTLIGGGFYVSALAR